MKRVPLLFDLSELFTIMSIKAYTVDRLARRIEHLGYRVHLAPMTTSVA